VLRASSQILLRQLLRGSEILADHFAKPLNQKQLTEHASARRDNSLRDGKLSLFLTVSDLSSITAFSTSNLTTTFASSLRPHFGQTPQ